MIYSFFSVTLSTDMESSGFFSDLGNFHNLTRSASACCQEGDRFESRPDTASLLKTLKKVPTAACTYVCFVFGSLLVCGKLLTYPIHTFPCVCVLLSKTLFTTENNTKFQILCIISFTVSLKIYIFLYYLLVNAPLAFRKGRIHGKQPKTTTKQNLPRIDLSIRTSHLHYTLLHYVIACFSPLFLKVKNTKINLYLNGRISKTETQTLDEIDSIQQDSNLCTLDSSSQIESSLYDSLLKTNRYY